MAGPAAAGPGRIGGLAGDADSSDRAGFLAIVQKDWRFGTRRCGQIDKGVDPAAGRQHQRAVAGLERLGWLAVDGHHADRDPLQFDSNNRALAAADDAQPDPFVGPS